MPTKRRVIRPSSASTEHDQLPASVPFGMPRYDVPEIPDDITIISDELLMQIFIRFVAWQTFAATEFAAAEVTEARNEAYLKFVEAQHMVTHWSSAKDKVTVARAEMAISEPVTQAREAYLQAYATRKMRQVVFDNCVASAAALSRELTRRTGRGDVVERRAARYAP